MTGIAAVNPEPGHRQGPASTAENNRKFLEQVVVWPGPQAPGSINLHSNMPNNNPAKNGGKPFVVGWAYKGINEFLNRALYIDNSGGKLFNAWFCMSQQSECIENNGKKKAVRKAANATWVKAIWVDIDVKPKPATWDAEHPGRTHYETFPEALAGLSRFVKKAGLPTPTSVVNSGGGLHAYWISKEPLAPDEWRPYAGGLKALLLQEGVKCDAGLTTDIARLLRVPGTLNHKYNPPRPVQLLHLGGMYDFPTALAVLPGAAPTKRAANTVSPSLQPAIEPASEDEVGGWFAKLLAGQQSEVVRHAARHIARNSKLFELTANGGKYDNYLKLAFPAARWQTPKISLWRRRLPQKAQTPRTACESFLTAAGTPNRRKMA
jgi:hypothetical protein